MPKDRLYRRYEGRRRKVKPRSSAYRSGVRRGIFFQCVCVHILKCYRHFLLSSTHPQQRSTGIFTVYIRLRERLKTEVDTTVLDDEAFNMEAALDRYILRLIPAAAMVIKGYGTCQTTVTSSQGVRSSLLLP
ncbi:uncharacterized protein LOC131258036 isoform X3 [Magnolia sinica]|uniref:uncharacterized protein LOC131258036 isoform X3 n=1 Tax=Magnolia sinica TaxID=86752 RepID=UPI00265AE04B|nr:uncharacterized protein LOC131258036 isoform X3 [Magnolia sinica]